ncbi:macrophage mannose receptor 1-like [Sinocyclocheilus grahami]|uniref:macrophage mannose receptor 1-like n=1 Tax=Sinocyclocheilus grahami TaxID=75366 RepID=UPI0007AC8D59|nr:PREDICTED: macrophage mannose receptor 1-like [Sinocyclocheilus grahami]
MKTTLALLLIMELCGLSSGLIKHHFFVKDKMTWDSASKYCKTYFHDLSTFTNENEEQPFLEDAAYQPSDAWVGLYKESGVWKWSGGENATQINWDTRNKQPENDGCAFLHKGHKKLHDIDCNGKYSFFCMNIELVLVLRNETWEGALEYCQKQNNDLASLSSLSMMDSALGKITQAQTKYVWTGLRFLAGDWFWVNGNVLDYTAWSKTGQPQCPARDLRCGALDKQTRDWTNRDCEETLNFFCSAQAVKWLEQDCGSPGPTLAAPGVGNGGGNIQHIAPQHRVPSPCSLRT